MLCSVVVTKNSNISDILVKAQPASSQVTTQSQTTLTDADTVVDGIKALSQATDIPNQELGAAIDAIVEITGDVPGLADKLVGPMFQVPQLLLQLLLVQHLQMVN